jgi:hypothetical protein
MRFSFDYNNTNSLIYINCKQVYPHLLFNTLFNTYLIATFALAIG